MTNDRLIAWCSGVLDRLPKAIERDFVESTSCKPTVKLFYNGGWLLGLRNGVHTFEAGYERRNGAWRRCYVGGNSPAEEFRL